VRANALARARELVAAEANNNRQGTVVLNVDVGRVLGHRRTLNTRLDNLQRRYNNLERLRTSTLSVSDPTQWNSLGNGAEGLFRYIRNHNLVGFVHGARINRLQQITVAANSYGLVQNNNNNNNNARANALARANNNAMAAWVGNRMNNDANEYELETKWNVNARNNAQAWYSNKKVKLMNTNVIRNLLDGRVFRPTDVNNLYFDANNKTQRHVFTKKQLIKSRGRNPFYNRNTLVVPRKLPADVKKAMVNFMNERVNKSVKMDINKQRGRGGKRKRHLETPAAADRYYNNSNNNGNNYKTPAQRAKIRRELKKLA
jgi:hypothetical protein